VILFDIYFLFLYPKRIVIIIIMSLFAQGSNKNSIKTKALQKKHTYTTQREHTKIKNT